ncbi:MAG TPA: cobaltochelatase subunit CobN [Desulfocapsa sulfexigens]|nr:cobaltochelatase subunit CobN [Desulfocapsa sulfexigens]
MELPSLSKGLADYRADGGKVKVIARTQSQLFDEKQRRRFIDQAMAADVVIIILHGGQPSFPAFDLLITAMGAANPAERPHLHIQPSSGDEDSLQAAREHSSFFGTRTWDMIHSYLNHGGSRNYHHLFTCLAGLAQGGGLAKYPEPVKPANEGIYHPDHEGIPELDEYLNKRINPEKLTVGLWFYQTYWINNNLSFIDAIIRAIEAQGANVIAVFHLRYKDADRGNMGADYIVDHFFMDKSGNSRIDVLINPLMFSLAMAGDEYEGLLSRLGVVCIQAMLSMRSRQEWQDSVQGMSSADVSFSAAQPEFDGNIITVPVATREQDELCSLTGGLIATNQPLPERVDKMVRLSLNWARLRRITNSERKVAIIFHHYPPRNDRIGCAAGLDSFSSVKMLLDRMTQEGYRIEQSYESGDELAGELLAKMTTDRRWLPPDMMAERASAQAGPEHYLNWHNELPESIACKMINDWGQPPGDLFVHAGKLLFAGLVNGNVFLTIQPPRGYFENIDKVYHDLYLSTPHHYLAQYRWIRDIFKADAVIHVGKHGSLEWLPGKALGLSQSCYPDLAIMELPNIYPYIINDPSEGTQAKRRSYACIIDHLTPASTNADLYEDMAELEQLLTDYAMAAGEDPGKVEVLRPMIWEAAETANLHRDLDIDQETAMADFNSFLDKLHEYLHELSDTMIADGLHTLGLAPEEERLQEFLVQLTRLANGSVPSLREAVLEEMGFTLDELLASRGRREERFQGCTGAEIIAKAHSRALALIRRLADTDFDPGLVHTLTDNLQISEVLIYIADTLVPNIMLCSEEIDATMTSLRGGFVRPGPSGAPTRGQADILPTGRNFYSVDPKKIPSPAAWEVGKRLGDALITRYLTETGNYPDSVGIIVYGGATMRTRGDDIAEIYYLMGLKPVWQKGSGNVSGLEVIPAEKLNRPRLDVVPRVSGFFRDAFPNLMEQLDEAVAMVAALNEPPESNILRRNVLADVEEYKKQGMSEEKARREATFRVFSCPPGTYGAGVSELIESKNWKNQEDLGNNYIRYSAHAYGRGSYGKRKPENFQRLLGRMDITVKNEDSREYDMMSCTDYYNYYGGLIVAVKTVRGNLPLAIMGDSSDPKRVKMRTTQEEAKHVLRSRLVNPKWLKGMKRHGYKGAGDISHMMDVVLGWDATAEVIDDWMYEAVAEKYVRDREMRDWMKDVNPYARQNIIEKLLEAIAREMWQAGSEMEDELREAYLDIEGDIEERIE